jgi:hypothetical protein
VASLKDNRDQLVVYLGFLAETIQDGVSTKALGKAYADASRHFRASGICDLLLDLDGDEYYHCLIRSAQTRKLYLERCHAENVFDDVYCSASNNSPLFDALACAQFELAKELARLSPTIWRERQEYEDDFAYLHFLHSHLLAESATSEGLDPIIAQFEAALEGQSSPRLDICKAFFQRDNEAFSVGFVKLIELRKKEVKEERKTATAEEAFFEPEARVFVEGLGLLKIAESLGFQTEREYPMCPAPARTASYRSFEVDGFPGISV